MELHIHPFNAFMAHTGTTLHLTLLLFLLTCGPILRYKSPSISNFLPVSFHYPSPVYPNNQVFKTGLASAEDNRSAPFRSLHICDDVRYVPLNKCCTATSRTEKSRYTTNPTGPLRVVSFGWSQYCVRWVDGWSQYCVRWVDGWSQYCVRWVDGWSQYCVRWVDGWSQYCVRWDDKKRHISVQ
jgi:hypothetical protein